MHAWRSEECDFPIHCALICTQIELLQIGGRRLLLCLTSIQLAMAVSYFWYQYRPICRLGLKYMSSPLYSILFAYVLYILRYYRESEKRWPTSTIILQYESRKSWARQNTLREIQNVTERRLVWIVLDILGTVVQGLVVGMWLYSEIQDFCIHHAFLR